MELVLHCSFLQRKHILQADMPRTTTLDDLLCHLERHYDYPPMNWNYYEPLTGRFLDGRLPLSLNNLADGDTVWFFPGPSPLSPAAL